MNVKSKSKWIFFSSLQPHRVSVRSVTANRRTSRDAACTMIIGRDVSHLGPTNVKATNITCSSAVISWLPANSNHQHVVCVNNVEVRTLKPGVYRHTITGKSENGARKINIVEEKVINISFSFKDSRQVRNTE